MKNGKTPCEMAAELLTRPEAIGWALGYADLKPELHGEWMRKMLTCDEDMTLQAHRGSFKTTCLCIVMALLMIRYPEKNIIFMRKTDTDVAEVVKNITRILQSEIIREMFFALTGAELAVIRSSTSDITTNIYCAPRGVSQLIGVGIGGSLTGKHADIVITDDIVNLRDRQSRAERDRTKDVYMELQNIKNRGGRIINTGTPWHKEDAFMLMPEPIKYDCYHTGLIGKEKLAELRQSMSPSLFAANYELIHIASEKALFATPPIFTADYTQLRDGIAQVDAAYGGEDCTAFTCGKRVGDKLYLYGRMWQGHVDTALDVILAECERLMCAPIWVESNADKGFLATEIRKMGFKAIDYPEKENKYMKISTYLRKWWNNIVWLEGTDKEYINQIMDYTEDAEHDDAPDSASVVCRYWDKRNKQNYQSAFGG